MQQSIKDVNQSLVDDSLVTTDKIGAMNIFWSFPLKAAQDQQHLRDSYVARKGTLQQSITNLQAEIRKARETRSDRERPHKLEELRKLEQQNQEFTKFLDDMKYNNPEEIAKIEKDIEKCKTNANIWTDNIWMLKSFLVKKKGMNSKEVC